MYILNAESYKVCEPLFEGVRVIMNFLGEPYSPEYIQGISGAAFRTAGICPCAPTCSAMMETADLIRLLGYEVKEFNISDNPDVMIGPMVDTVKKEIDRGRPALVWHAFTSAEWDVVCGYDKETGVFLGRGSYRGLDDFVSEPWNRAKEAVEICPSFGAIFIG